MIRITEQYIWQLVFGVFFAMVVIMGAIILSTESRIPLTALTPLDLVLITLASWRLTRLFLYDSITRFIREQFYDVEVSGRGYMLEKPKAGARRVLNELFTCPWCFGLWAATIVSFFYLLTPIAIFPVVLLAISAVASMLQIGGNLLGWQAEKVKGEVEGR